MDWFLTLLALVYLAIASVQDLRKREIWNWLSFSLIIFALAYRAFYSVLASDLWFFVYGVIGLAVFVILGYVFYYARVFAGGDVKLLWALGVVLPVSDIYSSLILTGMFILLFLFVGGLWGLGYSFFLVARNKEQFSMEFGKQIKKYRSFVLILLVVSLALVLVPVILNDAVFIFLPVIIFLMPLLYVYGKAIENSCMIQELATRKLTVGDWLVEPVKVGRKTIKPYWEGISEEELKILRKYRGKIKIKQGVPFVPAFLIAFVLLVLSGKYL